MVRGYILVCDLVSLKVMMRKGSRPSLLNPFRERRRYNVCTDQARCQKPDEATKDG
jgi:hypothetical protein